MSQKIIDQYIERAITLLRAAEGDAIEASRLLDDAIERIVKNIKKEQGKNVRAVLTLQEMIDNEMRSFYLSDLPTELSLSAEAVIVSELAWNEKKLSEIVTLGDDAKAISIPKKTEMVARASTKQYQGKTFDTWIRNEYRAKSKQMIVAMKEGFVNSQSISEIEKQVSNVANVARRDVRTIVRSNFMHNATEAKETVFAMNPELIEGAIWLSKLDNRTTPLICGIRDGLLYDTERNPIGHSLPWLDGPGRAHWNCRSISIPKIVGVPYNGTRAATEAGENYKRGDNLTRTGKVRKNHKAARDKGIFKTEQYTTKTNYESWLKRQANSNIDFVSDILGSKKNAQLFRDGKVTLQQLGLESPVAIPTSRNSI